LNYLDVFNRAALFDLRTGLFFQSIYPIGSYFDGLLEFVPVSSGSSSILPLARLPLVKTSFGIFVTCGDLYGLIAIPLIITFPVIIGGTKPLWLTGTL
jgi:hypothetical protein